MSRLLTLIGIFVHRCIRRTIPLKILICHEFTYKSCIPVYRFTGITFTKPTDVIFQKKARLKPEFFWQDDEVLDKKEGDTRKPTMDR